MTGFFSRTIVLQKAELLDWLETKFLTTYWSRFIQTA